MARMEIEKIHRVLELNQLQWLKSYIETITRRRRIEAEKHGDEITFCKLMNNAARGITIENLGNRFDIRLVSNKKDYLKWISKPNYISQKKIGNNLVAMHKSKVTIKLNKPACQYVYITFE